MASCPELRLLMAMAMIAWSSLLSGPVRSDDSVPREICDRPDDCQRLFEAEGRDEPWSSRLETQLHAFLNARAELVVKTVECHKTLCSITAATTGSSMHPWAMAMIEMHAMPWYSEFYGDSGTGSGPATIEVSPGLWHPDPAGFVAIRWFLERKPAPERLPAGQ